MEQEYYSKEDFVFYLYMRKSTKWNAKQADSLPKQDETAYFFIKENFSYLDYEKDIIKFEESATAFQDKKEKIEIEIIKEQEYIDQTIQEWLTV